MSDAKDNNDSSERVIRVIGENRQPQAKIVDHYIVRDSSAIILMIELVGARRNGATDNKHGLVSRLPSNNL